MALIMFVKSEVFDKIIPVNPPMEIKIQIHCLVLCIFDPSLSSY